MSSEDRGSPLHGVIFDFDGVLADTEALHLRAYQETLAGTALSLARDTYYERYLGYDDVGVFTALARDQQVILADDDLARLVRDKGKRFDALVDGGEVLFAGAVACVRRVAAVVPVGIASGALHHEIERIVSRAGLRDRFAAIVAADDVAHPKPAPDAYQAAVTRLSRSETPVWGRYVAIEDSEWGLEAARAAGLRRIGITNSYPAETLRTAELVVDHLSSVTPELLTRLCESP